MEDLDHRQLGRDSFFLMADLRLDGSTDETRVKVRNLSIGGMMAEGPVKVLRGTKLQVNIRNVGWVDGVVAWIQDNRFGIAFVEDIDPKVVREPVAANPEGTGTPRFVKVPLRQIDERQLRKI